MLNDYVPPNEYLKAGLGYGLSRKSQETYKLFQQKLLKDRRAVERVRRMIEESRTLYERGKEIYRSDLTKYTEITLNWSPERVLSTHKLFESMCRYLQDEKVWKMLSRPDRAFVARAYEYFLAYTQDPHN